MRGWRRPTLLGLLLVACTLVGARAAWGATGSAPQGRVQVYATYYGWFDNTPPGCATAYSGCAGGTGTYADPLTFASDVREFPVGTELYYPTVRKYFRMGDDCQECDLDWAGRGPDGGPGLHHADLWLGGRGGNAFHAIDCEDALTLAAPDGGPRLTTFITDPPADLPVSAQPLFNPRTGRCFDGATAPSSTGTYRNRATHRCLADPSRRVGAPARVSACRDDGTRITYQGAFLIHDHRCLRTTSGRPGARVVWGRCAGGPDEQWETNPDGTITWVQYTRCVAAVHGRVVLDRCDHRAAQRWAFRAR